MKTTYTDNDKITEEERNNVFLRLLGDKKAILEAVRTGNWEKVKERGIPFPFEDPLEE